MEELGLAFRNKRDEECKVPNCTKQYKLNKDKTTAIIRGHIKSKHTDVYVQKLDEYFKNL